MLRHIKKNAISQEQPAKQIKNEDGTIIRYEKPKAWCTIDEFPPLPDIFDLTCFMDQEFVEKVLTVFKPRPTDSVGYVYILQRQSDVQRLATGDISHIVLHKIGMTYKEPRIRVN